MKIDGDYIVLDSGKRLHAYAGVVGVSPNGILTHGVSGTLPDTLAPEEVREIAKYMIEQWRLVLGGWLG